MAGALNPAFAFATLSGKISQDDVVLNEAIRNGPVLQEHIKRTKPQSYVGLAGGGLGFSGGMALGLRLARPDRRIVQVIGDGGFISPRPTVSMRWRSSISFRFSPWCSTMAAGRR